MTVGCIYIVCMLYIVHAHVHCTVIVYMCTCISYMYMYVHILLRCFALLCLLSHIHVHVQCKYTNVCVYSVLMLINPRHACTARVTVVRSVCLVCLSVC